MKFIKSLIPYIVIIIVVFIVREFIVTPVQVVGTSMVPTLKDGELLLLDKISYNFSDIKRFDVVVVEKSDKAIIKRVIGLPNEKVEYKDNRLYINDKLVNEKFSRNGKTYDYIIENNNIIPKDYYFVVGDNRINSEDSRSIGLIHIDEIEGKTSFALFPFSKFGFVN